MENAHTNAEPQKNKQPQIYGLTLNELEQELVKDGFPKYRATQIWHGLYDKFAADWNSIPGIPSGMQDYLASRFSIKPCSVLTSQTTVDGTTKLLVTLNDGERIETVIIPSIRKRIRGAGKSPEPNSEKQNAHVKKNTVCVSSQVGCRFACAFCASGAAGLVRNLEPGEIICQIIEAAKTLGQTPDNIVFMGVGEPLDNYDNVLEAIRIINHPKGLGTGARRITISTCGLVPEILKLAGEGLQVELSVSLHSCNNETRTILMPVNKKYPLEKLLEACAEYSRSTGRIITFEYTLINGLNDSSAHAAKLGNTLRALGKCRVNLIPLSQVKEFRHGPPTPRASGAFSEILRSKGINVTLRRSKGSKIKAACGQLRRQEAGQWVSASVN